MTNTDPPEESADTVGAKRTQRRRFLAALGALGITGVAGCGGDGNDTPGETDDTDMPGETDDTDMPGETDDTDMPGETDDTDMPGETDDTDMPGETDDTTPTDGSGCNIPDPPEPLVSFDGVRDGAVVLSPTSETMTGQFTNPYLNATLESGSVTLDVPEGDWTIEPESGTSFETLESQAQADDEIVWNVSVPQVRTEFDVTLMVSYSCGEETYEAEATQTIRIGPETASPAFVDYDVVAEEGTPASVVRQNAHFTPLQLLPGGGAQMVYFPQEPPDEEPFVSITFPWAGNYDDGEWHHMAVAFDATDGLSGYIDGDLIATGPSEPGELQPAEFVFGLAGAVSAQVAEPYDGSLDEVAVYSTALSQEQATALANGETAAEDSLVSKWSFEEVVYDRVEDQVGDNTLFLANSPEQVSGESGQAVAFDGETNFAGAANSDSLNLTAQKSISFFFKTTQSVPPQ